MLVPMPRKARVLTGEEEIYEAALRALGRRPYSAWELRRYLEQRGAEAKLTRRVLARLRSEGWLDDARYARQFAWSRATGRRQGRWRIFRELRARGVAEQHIRSALEEIFQETDERVLLQQKLAGWLKRHRDTPLDTRRLAALHRALLRAGFSSDAIQAELARLTRNREFRDVGTSFSDEP